MKKLAIAAILLLGAATSAFAQKTGEKVKMFEEAYARNVEPEMKVYIRPQVAEVEFLSKERETYGPYKYNIKSPDVLDELMLENFKNRALYRASLEADADVMIAAIFDSYILENDAKYIVIEFSAYPAKYVNFHKFGDSPTDIQLINACYPALNTAQGKLIEAQLKAGAATK